MEINMNVEEEVERMSKLFIGFCDKQYKVGYLPYGSIDKDYIKFVTGEMINYNNGNIILSNKDGVWHIPYGSVKWVLPIKTEQKSKNKIKHGKWFLLDKCSNAGVYCSICYKKVYREDYANQKLKSKYCPNCGAMMDLD